MKDDPRQLVREGYDLIASRYFIWNIDGRLSPLPMLAFSPTRLAFPDAGRMSRGTGELPLFSAPYALYGCIGRTHGNDGSYSPLE